MSEALMASLRSNGPVSPAVQLRKLLEYGRERDWEFETAWRWAFERVRWPHDTTHRKEWKMVLGERHDDPRRVPEAHRTAWRSAYDRSETHTRELSAGMLIAA